ncbi:MAG: hypothetical protein IH917_10635 [Acidobacteria bacterium]|nr:hypothetical protein [Acidobacteriota bacterium]
MKHPEPVRRRLPEKRTGFTQEARVADRYAITSCGASIGQGYGPKIVAARPLAAGDLKNSGAVLAIPGTRTTAFAATWPSRWFSMLAILHHAQFRNCYWCLFEVAFWFGWIFHSSREVCTIS